MVKCTKQTERPNGYHFLECGLDYVYLLNGYEITQDADFGESVTIYNADKLHREIARTVLLYREKLGGQEIKFFRSLLRLTQEQLANKFGYTRETVVRWESGNSEIPETVDWLLRIIVWEKYLDEAKTVGFFEEHKKERTHYTMLNMVEAKNTWESNLAA